MGALWNVALETLGHECEEQQWSVVSDLRGNRESPCPQRYERLEGVIKIKNRVRYSASTFFALHQYTLSILQVPILVGMENKKAFTTILNGFTIDNVQNFGH